jgi:UDP-N-acetylmuramoyl-tripeptide--D-alanyl-D-alanine ligase
MTKRAMELGVDVTYINDKKELAETLKDYLRPEDAVLFKGSRGMKLEEVIEMIYSSQEA